MLLYLWLTFFITIEMVFSGPLLANNLLTRYDRRASNSYFNTMAKDNVYKRGKLTYNQYGEPTSVGRRAVVAKGTGLWPNGVIPYDMSKMNSDDQAVIKESMQRIMEDTATSNGGDSKPCITFVPRSYDDETYIKFKYGAPGDCSAHVGYKRRFKNVVVLGDTCMYLNIVQHELMHVIGFQHEQNSPNRDDYVKVYPQNIDPELLDQFEKYGKDDVVDLNIPYDVNSIMQYPTDAFQKPGATGPSMVSIDPAKPIPPYIMDRRLSPLDVLGVQRLYQCSS